MLNICELNYYYYVPAAYATYGGGIENLVKGLHLQNF